MVSMAIITVHLEVKALQDGKLIKVKYEARSGSVIFLFQHSVFLLSIFLKYQIPKIHSNFVSNIHIPNLYIHIPTSNSHIPAINIQLIQTTLNLV